MVGTVWTTAFSLLHFTPGRSLHRQGEEAGRRCVEEVCMVWVGLLKGERRGDIFWRCYYYTFTLFWTHKGTTKRHTKHAETHRTRINTSICMHKHVHTNERARKVWQAYFACAGRGCYHNFKFYMLMCNSMLNTVVYKMWLRYHGDFQVECFSKKKVIFHSKNWAICSVCVCVRRLCLWGVNWITLRSS